MGVCLLLFLLGYTNCPAHWPVFKHENTTWGLIFGWSAFYWIEMFFLYKQNIRSSKKNKHTFSQVILTWVFSVSKRNFVYFLFQIHFFEVRKTKGIWFVSSVFRIVCPVAVICFLHIFFWDELVNHIHSTHLCFMMAFQKLCCAELHTQAYTYAEAVQVSTTIMVTRKRHICRAYINLSTVNKAIQWEVSTQLSKTLEKYLYIMKGEFWKAEVHLHRI